MCTVFENQTIIYILVAVIILLILDIPGMFNKKKDTTSILNDINKRLTDIEAKINLLEKRADNE